MNNVILAVLAMAFVFAVCNSSTDKSQFCKNYLYLLSQEIFMAMFVRSKGYCK